MDARRLPAKPAVVDLTSGLPPLPHLPLLVRRIFGGLEDWPSWKPLSTSFATVGAPPRQPATNRSFRDFLSARAILLSVVLGYFTFLADQCLVYRTVTLHRSILSATHPPLDGHKIGQHPLILHLLRGIFQRRPPSFFPSWDVAAMFAVFSSPPRLCRSPASLRVGFTLLRLGVHDHQS